MAVLDYVGEKGACPWELVEALLCDEKKLWPKSGSFEEQDIVQLLRFNQLVALHRALYTLLHEGQKHLSASERRLVGDVLAWDLERGKKVQPTDSS